MADDNNASNRTGTSSDRGSANPGQGDPLAELARLIGQNDPFADFGRDQRSQSQPASRAYTGDAALASPSYFDSREKPGASMQNHTEQQAPPAFIQAGHEHGSYRDSSPLPHDGDFDNAEPSGRGRKFMTKSAVITLAVLGVVGAFGYRFIFADSGTSVPPRVIHANTEPTKVPPPVAADAAQSKSTYDRVGERGQGERLTSREEAPVDVNSLPRQGGRNAPAQNANAQWGNAAAPNLPGSASSGGSTAPSAMGDPKRVRTVTIRPNQSDADMAPAALTPPTASTPPTQAGRPAPQAPTAAVQRAPAAAPQGAAPAANAPLALNDDPSPANARRQANTPAQPRPAPAPRQTPPAQEAQPQAQPPPQPLAQVTAPKAGGFLVQVSSQRSEAEAQAALRTVQTKFPNVLSGQQTTIRRVDLGERGTFYRAMLGPFANRDQASQVCANLKAAGGDCIIPAN